MATADIAHDILSRDFAQDPYPTYQVMLADQPLVWHEPMRSYIISRYDDVVRAFREPAFTSDNYEWQIEPLHGGRTIVQMSGREHAVRRALVAPAFRGNDLRQRFLPMIERDATELIDAFGDTGSADLVGDFARQFPINVIVDMLGLDRADQARFQRWYGDIVAFLGNLSQDPEIAAAGHRTGTELTEYLLPVIARRRANLGDDLLSTLCSAAVEGTTMSDHDIKSFVSLLLAAGGETTDKAISSLFKNLLEHPDQLAAVRADRALIPQAFAETLRFSPPVHMIMRQPDRDVDVSGGTIPAGATVTCLIAAANRDPRRFAEPNTFNIFRTDLPTATAFSAAAGHLAFALGRHFCVGAVLAKTEVEVATNRLLDAMPDLRIADGAVLTEQGVFTRGPASLPVRFTPAA